MTIETVPPVGVVTEAPSGEAPEVPPPIATVPPAGAVLVPAAGGAAPACGVTAAEGADAGPGPAMFEADTVNV